MLSMPDHNPHRPGNLFASTTCFLEPEEAETNGIPFVGEIGLHGTQAAFHMGPVWAPFGPQMGPRWAQMGPIWEYFLGMDPITLVPNLS